MVEVPVIKENNKRKPNLLPCIPHVYMGDTQEERTLRSGLDLRLSTSLVKDRKKSAEGKSVMWR